MPTKQLFAKKMAQKLKDGEMEQVSGGVMYPRTMKPGSSTWGGGVDWVDTGEDFMMV